MGDPGAAGQVPEADRSRPDLGDGLDGGLQQGPPKVAVMVGPSVLAWADVSGHARIIANNLAIDKIARCAYVDTDKIKVREVQQ
jgi:hypothetical protein